MLSVEQQKKNSFGLHGMDEAPYRVVTFSVLWKSHKIEVNGFNPTAKVYRFNNILKDQLDKRNEKIIWGWSETVT